jgi:hypothetical protein
MKPLTLEIQADLDRLREKYHATQMRGDRGGTLSLSPPVSDDDYWLFRVQVSAKQALVAFPKHGTIGIGFQVEEQDWNANLPYIVRAEDIAKHIAHNAAVVGDDETPSPETVLAAIKMLQAEIHRDMGTTPGNEREFYRG